MERFFENVRKALNAYIEENDPGGIARIARISKVHRDTIKRFAEGEQDAYLNNVIAIYKALIKLKAEYLPIVQEEAPPYCMPIAKSDDILNNIRAELIVIRNDIHDMKVLYAMLKEQVEKNHQIYERFHKNNEKKRSLEK